MEIISQWPAVRRLSGNTPRTARGMVVMDSSGAGDNPRNHESVTRMHIARKLAVLKGYEFAGEYDSTCRYAAPLYFVPAETLVGTEAASALNIHSEHDLFGGVVPHSFVASKTISHALIDGAAAAPAGWSGDFQRGVRDAVLAGYTAFARHDAFQAGIRLLEGGAVRVKRACETGGRGQQVAATRSELEDALGPIDDEEIRNSGLVLEQDLTDVTTYSVGRVRVGELVASYYGTQSATRDNNGALVYGGSDLFVVRGDFDVLLTLDLSAEVRLAIHQACAYDAAARTCFPGLLASRCNYDVARGCDREGRYHSGVLEQSWRIGGASGAEVGALEAFHEDRALRAVRATCTEVYGDSADPPPHATVYFRGVDERVGRITKCTVIEPYGDPR